MEECLENKEKRFSIVIKSMMNISEENKAVLMKQNIYNVCLCMFFTLLFVIVSLFCITKSDSDIEVIYIESEVKHKVVTDKVVSCYYNFPSASTDSQLMPHNVDAHLCTHINVAFAQVKDKQIYLSDFQLKTVTEIVQLKKINPNLKVLLSVGGAGNDDGFSNMVVNHMSRKEFIKSIKNTLRNNSLDGIDLDWEFPALHKYNSVAGKRERQHFSQLLREIRMEYNRERRGYLLTAALAAPQIIVDVAYDVDQINLYVDYVNIMTYDFHYYTQFTPFTGLNSPLYARASEHFYMETLNINYTVHMYLNKGLNESKIVVGIPTYGHTFLLVNNHNVAIGSPASGYGSLGSLGFVNYPDICNFIRNNSDVTIVEEKNAGVPYLYKNKEWVSYDTPKSVTEKAKYIRDYRLRGAMIYSLNSDDYEGFCGENTLNSYSHHFPLATSVKNIIVP